MPLDELKCQHVELGQLELQESSMDSESPNLAVQTQESGH